jgi:hypothetical protein
MPTYRHKQLQRTSLYNLPEFRPDVQALRDVLVFCREDLPGPVPSLDAMVKWDEKTMTAVEDWVKASLMEGEDVAAPPVLLPEADRPDVSGET